MIKIQVLYILFIWNHFKLRFKCNQLILLCFDVIFNLIFKGICSFWIGEKTKVVLKLDDFLFDGIDFVTYGLFFFFKQFGSITTSFDGIDTRFKHYSLLLFTFHIERFIMLIKCCFVGFKYFVLLF